MRISHVGVDLIKHFEGLRQEAYQCAAGVWTIGYGHTKGVQAGDRITLQQAEQMLEDDLLAFETGVLELITMGARYSQGEFDGLVSIAFNIGLDALARSTLLSKFNAGDRAGAADEFLRWNKAAGRVLEGLTRRRRAERALFLRQDWRVAAGLT
ncbi:MAG TPA: lysozyme [Gammaproteobacteria bacterium]|nr:lysozyme [Gammaproteobacteria bacterium]MCH78746.1 lysozyme [Gammaproteobacteria bacterium]